MLTSPQPEETPVAADVQSRPHFSPLGILTLSRAVVRDVATKYPTQVLQRPSSEALQGGPRRPAARTDGAGRAPGVVFAGRRGLAGATSWRFPHVCPHHREQDTRCTLGNGVHGHEHTKVLSGHLQAFAMRRSGVRIPSAPPEACCPNLHTFNAKTGEHCGPTGPGGPACWRRQGDLTPSFERVRDQSAVGGDPLRRVVGLDVHGGVLDLPGGEGAGQTGLDESGGAPVGAFLKVSAWYDFQIHRWNAPRASPMFSASAALEMACVVGGTAGRGGRG
jgi:hypothetical protein